VPEAEAEAVMLEAPEAWAQETAPAARPEEVKGQAEAPAKAAGAPGFRVALSDASVRR